MRVLLVNTAERTGGAAIACNRLMVALKRQGVRAKMLVRDKQTDRITVVALKPSVLLPLKFVWERVVIFLCNRLRRKGIFQVDIANVGTDITQLREFQQADVVHLHWTNQGFLSLSDLEKIVRSGKSVVVTMHDMWYFTGICHYAADCDRYRTECRDCPQLGGGRALADLAARVFRRKEKIYSEGRLTFVGCSRWIANLARESKLTRGHEVVNIPNAIDLKTFRPAEKIAARQRLGIDEGHKVVLFGAQRITDERKGFGLLAEACRLIRESNAELAEKIELLVVGGEAGRIENQVPFAVKAVSYVKEEEQMVALYNVADLYVTPSLQDNLPNTIVEAMACGVPCVGFNIGGIPEMIDHRRNGYVAEERNAADLARGIEWVLTTDHEALAAAARQKAEQTYGEKVVARKYMDVYDNACNRNI